MEESEIESLKESHKERATCGPSKSLSLKRFLTPSLLFNDMAKSGSSYAAVTEVYSSATKIQVQEARSIHQFAF